MVDRQRWHACVFKPAYWVAINFVARLAQNKWRDHYNDYGSVIGQVTSHFGCASADNSQMNQNVGQVMYILFEYKDSPVSGTECVSLFS